MNVISKFFDKTLYAVVLGVVPTGIFTVFGIFAMALGNIISEDYAISIMPISIPISLVIGGIIYYFDNRRSQNNLKVNEK